MKTLRVSLTVHQAELVLWACEAGLEQHEKFVRHDNWDYDMTKKERHHWMASDRKFERAIAVMSNALLKLEK